MPDIETARSWYPADPVHGFDHILRVYRLASLIAVREGADLEIVQAACLLHDTSGDLEADPSQNRETHHHSSAEFARQVLKAEGWPEERIEAVEHCIRAHRFRDHREPPQALEAKVLFDADKLDAIGAIGVARAVAYAANDCQPFYVQPSGYFLQTGKLEPGEPHSAYHEFIFKLRHLKERLFTPTAKEIAGERHRFMQEFYVRLGEEIEGKK